MNATHFRLFRSLGITRLLLWSVFGLLSLICKPEAFGQVHTARSAAGPSLVQTHRDAVPRAECFPVETLEESSRSLSKKLLLDALDSEALFTLVGGIKPVSEGFFDTWFQVDQPDSTELAEVRQALSVWQCGSQFEAGMLPFKSLRSGERYAAAWIASRPQLDRILGDQNRFWASLGVTRDLSAEAILLNVEGADRPGDRWRGMGYVFGYPKRAVDFFVRAGEHYSSTGEFVERDFRNYPTHSLERGGFVYAVPKLDKASSRERSVRKQVDAILTVYRGLREKYVVGDDPQRIVELVRDWFDDGSGRCHPDHAMQKTLAWKEAREWVESEAVRLTTVEPLDPLDDLKELDSVLGQSRIVALGESTHGTREFFQLKHRIFRYLVEEQGVRLFGIEASYAACTPINNYVRSGVGDPREAIKGQGFWTWDTEEVLDLVQWMKDWNEQRPSNSPPLEFYGFDTQDGYTPLKLVFEQLNKDGNSEVEAFERRLAIALEGPYSDAINNATIEQLDALKAAIRELGAYCSGLAGQTDDEVAQTKLLLEQAEAAIEIDRSRLERWSSIGMLAEVDLYSRIRANLPSVDGKIAEMSGEAAETLLELVRAAADLTRCQLRFRDELTPDERQAWRDAVQWGVVNAESDAVRQTLKDLKQFLSVSTEYLQKPKKLVNARDASMAKFVSSILALHGQDSRIVLWAHDWHVSKLDGNPVEDMPRMGTYLEQRYGADYLPIGLSFGSGAFQARYYPEEDEDPAKRVLKEFRLDGSRYDSFSHLFDFQDASVSAFVLAGELGASLPRWFQTAHVNRTIGAVYQPKLERSESYYEEMAIAEHYEIVLHVRDTERARPLSPAPRFRFGAQLKEISATDHRSSDKREGVCVEGISADSLAERCGLQEGDQIKSVGGHHIKSLNDFETRLAAIAHPGTQELVVLREGASDNDKSEMREVKLYILVPPWIVD
ncbi:MAG: erythromycin esterase family protein [Aureliella sp.]